MSLAQTLWNVYRSHNIKVNGSRLSDKENDQMADVGDNIAQCILLSPERGPDAIATKLLVAYGMAFCPSGHDVRRAILETLEYLQAILSGQIAADVAELVARDGERTDWLC